MNVTESRIYYLRVPLSPQAVVLLCNAITRSLVSNINSRVGYLVPYIIHLLGGVLSVVALYLRLVRGWVTAPYIIHHVIDNTKFPLCDQKSNKHFV